MRNAQRTSAGRMGEKRGLGSLRLINIRMGFERM
jgi:hypothetical protein